MARPRVSSPPNRTILCTILAFCLLSGLVVAQNDERILSYDSRIEVHADGSARVTETIRVRAQRQQIKRGIYRQLPMIVEVLKVQRDHYPEDHHTEEAGRGIRIYAGRQQYFLGLDEYTYTFQYEVELRSRPFF